MIPPVGSPLDHLALLFARALALGEAASALLARAVSIVGALVLGRVATGAFDAKGIWTSHRQKESLA